MSIRIVVDRIACDGHGVCAELFPEGITLDDWGYPILREGDVPAHLERHARRAASACPSLALKIRRSPRTAPAGATAHVRS